MQEYKTIDLAKFIAAIMVVAIHTQVFCEMDCLFYYTRSFCRIAVPFFFCVSSYLFFRRSAPIKKYVRRIFIMYVSWFVIELPYVIDSHFGNPDTSVLRDAVFFVRDLFLGNTFHASWYLTASVTSVVMVYFLSNKLKQLKLPGCNLVLLLIGIALYTFSLAASSYYGLISRTPLNAFNDFVTIYLIPANSFFASFIYVVLGKILAEKPINIKINGLVFIVFIILWIIEIICVKSIQRINDAFILLPLLTYFLVNILLNSQINFKDSITLFFRRSSILIYFLHYCFLEINVRFFDMHLGTALFVIVLVESIVMSAIILGLSKKIPILKYLY